MKEFVNIAAYKFVALEPSALPSLRAEMKERALACDLKGTILLSHEGINLFLAGTPENIESYQAFLAAKPAFSGLVYKESLSDTQPFSRMLVRLKKEIISMGHAHVQPEKHTAPHLSPEKLKEWYEQGHEMIVLDTRNDYEIELGTFKGAVDLKIDSFRDFPEAISSLPESAKDKPVVTFCTGGIRCEKAAEYMLQKGYKEVYQLDGGILNYFEKCGGAHYDGECFVFDKRVAVNSKLEETQTKQCYSCRAPIALIAQSAATVCPQCQSDQIG